MIGWESIPGIIRPRYAMLIDGKRNGWWISSVQHPTVLRPYTVHRPNGEAVGPNYRLLALAKMAAVDAMIAEEEDAA